MPGRPRTRTAARPVSAPASCLDLLRRLIVVVMLAAGRGRRTLVADERARRGPKLIVTAVSTGPTYVTGGDVLVQVRT